MTLRKIIEFDQIKGIGILNFVAISLQLVMLVGNYYKIVDREIYVSSLFIMSNFLLIFFHLSLLKHRVPNVKDWLVFAVGHSMKISDVIGTTYWGAIKERREEIFIWLKDNDIRYVANERYIDELILFSKSDAAFLKLSLQESSEI